MLSVDASHANVIEDAVVNAAWTFAGTDGAVVSAPELEDDELEELLDDEELDELLELDDEDDDEDVPPLELDELELLLDDDEELLLEELLLDEEELEDPEPLVISAVVTE